MEYNLEKMVAQHTGLVKSVAMRLSFVYGAEVEDLIQIGYVGLIKAIRGFDESKGYKFSTYAVPMITGEIKSQLRDQGKIKVSRAIKKDIAVIKQAEELFVLKNGKSPKISDLVEGTNLTKERVVQALQAKDALNNMENYEEVGLVTREEESCITKMDIMNSLRKLSIREQQVMILRYYRDMTQQQVAELLGISQVQICRIEKKSLKTMGEIMGK